MLLIERKGVSLQSMQESHTNLEVFPIRLPDPLKARS